ncbi:RCC1 domain-containing protein, partial [Mycobacterium tuberculosis]
PSDVTDVIAISAGNNHSLALKADGTVVAWGDNSNFHINVPPGLTNVTAIFAGTNASYALRSDGTVAMWGNGGGLTPSFIADLSDIVSLSIRGNSLLAIKPDGSVVSDQTVPGSDLLNSITLQEGAFTEVFNRLDTSYTYYYDGHSLDSVHLAAVLLHPAHADLYVNDLQVLDGSEIE